MFSVNDKVFYPFHGAGEIIKKEQKNITGTLQDYLIIKFSITDTTIMLPENNAVELGLRHLSDEMEIKKCFDIIANSVEEIEEDWKTRYKKYQECLKSGKITDIAYVVKRLFERNQIKELSTTEKKLYNSAFQMLISEISLVIGKDEAELKKELQSILSNQY